MSDVFEFAVVFLLVSVFLISAKILLTLEAMRKTLDTMLDKGVNFSEIKVQELQEIKRYTNNAQRHLFRISSATDAAEKSSKKLEREGQKLEEELEQLQREAEQRQREGK